MTLINRHYDRCRHDRHVMCATLGVGFYGTLALAVTAYSALLSICH